MYNFCKQNSNNTEWWQMTLCPLDDNWNCQRMQMVPRGTDIMHEIVHCHHLPFTRSSQAKIIANKHICVCSLANANGKLQQQEWKLSSRILESSLNTLSVATFWEISGVILNNIVWSKKTYSKSFTHKKLWKTFKVSTVLANVLAPLCARTSTDTVMIHSESHKCGTHTSRVNKLLVNRL